MRIFLVRHTAVDVESGTCYGQSDVPLKESFESEAAIVKAKLDALVDSGIKFNEVYTSPLSRCVKLATYCGYADANKEDKIKEINFGEWELRKFSEIKDPRLQEWYDNYLEVRVTGGESFRDQFERVAEFLGKLRNSELLSRNSELDSEFRSHTPPSNAALLFTHGGVIGCARVFAKQLAPEEVFSNLTDYGGVVEINI